MSAGDKQEIFVVIHYINKFETMATQKRIKTAYMESDFDKNTIKTKPNVLSLLTICINFVAENIHLVDTFAGLPDIIGKKIFKAAEHHGKFDIQEKGSYSAMETFTNVYEEYVLSEFNSCKQHLGLNYCFEHICLFTDLQKLDVSECGLGENHDYIKLIAKMEKLSELSLRKNSLTDKAILTLTLPYRMFNKGPSQLNTLDISENEDLSSKVISYLNPFKYLTKIDVTATCVMKSCEKNMLKSWKYTPFEGCSICQIYTKGWAANVVNGWLKFAEEQAAKPAKKDKSLFSLRSTKYKKQVEEIKNPTVKTANMNHRFRLLLTRKDQQTQQKTQATSTVDENLRRHKEISSTWIVDRTLRNGDVNLFGLKEKHTNTKRKHLNDSDLEDSDLMDIYKINK